MRSVIARASVVLLCCTGSARGQDTTPKLPPVAQLPAPEVSFADWLAALRAEARTRGISEATLDRALTGLEPVPIVIDRDRNQAELVLTLEQYLGRRLTKEMTSMAHRVTVKHASLLRRVTARYGVPRGIIVAVWGLESNFGRFSGVRPTIATLATLAYDPRRSGMFREELFDALKIVDDGDVDASALKGSWAGALGQPQFMPSSFLKYAQDFDGDGRRDIWKSEPDVLASIANFLREHGWTPSGTWGREVTLPTGLEDRLPEVAPLRTEGCLAERQMTVAVPLQKWASLGVRAHGGGRLPVASFDASLVSAGHRHFLVYPNYAAILAYNCVHAYGISVGLLSDRVR